MKIIILFAFLALASALPRKVSVSVHRPNIINGKEADPHSIPWQAWLVITGKQGTWMCGGSLISKKYVLTAGHCVDGAKSGTVLLGAHNIEENEDTQKLVTIKRFIERDDFDINLILNDVGLIELNEEVEETDSIKAGILPTSDDNNNTYEGETARVSGWGLTNGFGQISDVLRYEEDVIISNAECKEYFPDNVYDYVVCLSATSGRGSCNGDSGGPLSVKRGDDHVIVGIVSFGVTFCFSGYPSAFTRTTSFRSWIAENSDVKM